ncbi:MAG: hypothetical protein PHY31_08055 [Smithellaceae bacterium]|nr:hypothetical protein [Smithellaceae bacterium]
MLNHPEVTAQALSILRSGANFQWYVIPLLALVAYVYAHEISIGNWKAIAGGLALYMVHWLCEIINALIQHFSGHALWTVPTGTAFLLLVGVGIEISLMFSIAGLVLCKTLPEDTNMKIAGVNVKFLSAVGMAAVFSIIELFLVQTPTFVWVYPWWGALPVFVTVYIPFFLAAAYCYAWKPKAQITFIGTLFIINAVMLYVFAGVLKWI